MSDAPNDVSGWRREIDDLDEQIVNLANRRAQAAMAIGRLKNQSGQAVYVPNREQQVLEHIRQVNKGPLPDAVLVAIWRELMSGCIALEKPLKVGFLGPEGSFSHLAAIRKFGSATEYVPQSDIRSVFLEVARGQCHLGIVPVENSLGGAVIDTLDAFLDLDVKICGELILTIHHNLLANCGLREIKAVYSKPEVFAQCRTWLATQLKGVETISTASTAKAAELASHEKGIAAIGSKLAAELYNLPVVCEHIEDNPNNFTRFLIISRNSAGRTGNDKTAILFATAHRAGALVEVLDVFKKHKVNLTSIDSRPSGRQRWEYFFFVDAEGHTDDPDMAAAIQEAKQHCLLLSILGSFPKASEPME
jgi:chorismate mutase/prephenate dehydratase